MSASSNRQTRVIETVRPGVKLYRLSRNTNRIDVAQVVRTYLESIGEWKRSSRIGDLEVWVRAEGNRAVASGPTRESVLEPLLVGRSESDASSESTEAKSSKPVSPASP